MREIGIGIIGAGSLGIALATAYKSVVRTSPHAPLVALKTIADEDRHAASRAAAELNFERWRSEWQWVIEDPDIQLISIGDRDDTGKIALAALKAGKHVVCSHAPASTTDEARTLMEAAAIASVVTVVGYEHLYHPLIQAAHEIIRSGDLGSVKEFRADIESDHTSLNDDSLQNQATRSMIAVARYLLGPIIAANANRDPMELPEENATGHAALAENRVERISSQTLRFTRGFSGCVKVSSVVTGRQTRAFMRIDGAKGSLELNLGATSTLEHVYISDDQMIGTGAPIDANARHYPSGLFTGQFHQPDGRLDTIAIAAVENLNAVTRNASSSDFRLAWQIEQVIEAVAMSARSKTWQGLNDELPAPKPEVYGS